VATDAERMQEVLRANSEKYLAAMNAEGLSFNASMLESSIQHFHERIGPIDRFYLDCEGAWQVVLKARADE